MWKNLVVGCTQVKQQVLSAMPIDNSLRETLVKDLETFENPFEYLNTESKRVNYFNKKWGVVEPVEKC